MHISEHFLYVLYILIYLFDNRDFLLIFELHRILNIKILITKTSVRNINQR
jgi:hypothetical protein